MKKGSDDSRLKSYLEFLILILISVLFASNAYAQTVPPTTFIDLEYSYDGIGNVTSIIDRIDSQNNRSMQYDNMDRLTGATGPWGPGSFSYDSIGNRMSKSIGSTSRNYSYGASDNRLSGYSHDANGNLLQDDNFTYDYDSENRLIAVRSGANVIVQYKYDGDGRRISKTANGETTYYAYGTGLNVLTEFNSQGVPKYDYIYAGNKNIARVNFDANGAPESKIFYHSDDLGSSLAITDAFTTVVWNQNYLPFGEFYSGAGTLPNSHQYTGKEYETETGLYYYGARYYHPGFGRFMSVDPAGIDITNPQSLNRYAYVLNNPFKYVDPDGEIAVNVQKIIDLNSQIRNKLDFVPNFILDILLPADAESLVASSLPGPQVLGSAVLAKSASKTLFVTPGRFEGVKELSQALRNARISRKERLKIINSFSEGTIAQKIARGNENPLRYFGGEANVKGRFLTPYLPAFGSARDVLSLPPENLGTGLAQFRLRKGAIFFEGTVAPNFKRPGGGVQYFVPNLDDLLPVP